jgi:Rrf2 family protein
MPISNKGEYAARAMLHLALAYGGGAPVKTGEIAERQRIPRKYLEQILLVFKKVGFVRSKPGSNGGYLLAKPPKEITMADVIRAVDGPLAPVRCVSMTAYAPCTSAVEATCALRTVWKQARDAMVGVLEETTLEEVAQRARHLAQASAVPMYYI